MSSKTKKKSCFFSGEFWPMPGRFLAGGANRSIPTIEEGEGWFSETNVSRQWIKRHLGILLLDYPEGVPEDKSDP